MVFKRILKIVVFCCLCIFAISVYSRLTLVKADFGINQIHNFYQVPRDSVDIITFGASCVYCNYSPKVMEDEYGFSMYNLSSASQDIWNTYYLLRESLKYQSPKVVVIDTADIYWEDEWSDKDDIVQTLYGMRPSTNKLGVLYASIPASKWGEYMPSFVKCRGKEITSEDVRALVGSFPEGETLYRGFISTYDTGDATKHKIPRIIDTSPAMLTDKREKYLRKILEYCEKKNQPVLVVNSMRGDYSQKNFRGTMRVAEILAEYEINGVDFNLAGYTDDMDWEKDVSDDNVHLNVSGAGKATRKLADYLISNYDMK